MQSRLKQLRMNFGLDRQAFADLLGCTAAEVEAWEKASEAPAEAVARIAKRFGVNSEWLRGADVSIYSARLLELQKWVTDRILALTGPNLIRMISATTGERISAVIAMLQQAEPELLTLDVVAAWLGLAPGSARLLLAGRLDPGSPVIARASDLSGVPQPWFREGPAE